MRLSTRTWRRSEAVVLGLILTFLTHPTLAACDSVRCTSEQIKRLYTGTIATYIQFASNQLPTGCTPKDGGYLTLETSHPNYKGIYATLLMAFSTNQPVSVRIYDGSDGCLVQYVYVDK